MRPSYSVCCEREKVSVEFLEMEKVMLKVRNCPPKQRCAMWESLSGVDCMLRFERGEDNQNRTRRCTRVIPPTDVEMQSACTSASGSLNGAFRAPRKAAAVGRELGAAAAHEEQCSPNGQVVRVRSQDGVIRARFGAVRECQE